VAPLSTIGDTDKTGTKMTFKPDTSIFTATDFQYDILASRLRELSFLNAGFLISLTDERDGGRQEVFEYRGASASFVEHLNKAKEPVHDKVVSIVGEHLIEGGAAPVAIELALQWNASYQEQIFCYTNNVPTRTGVRT